MQSIKIQLFTVSMHCFLFPSLWGYFIFFHSSLCHFSVPSSPMSMMADNARFQSSCLFYLSAGYSEAPVCGQLLNRRFRWLQKKTCQEKFHSHILSFSPVHSQTNPKRDPADTWCSPKGAGNGSSQTKDSKYCFQFAASWQAHYYWTRIKPLCPWFRLKKRLSAGYPLVQIAASSTKRFPTTISRHPLVWGRMRLQQWRMTHTRVQGLLAFSHMLCLDEI